jgi:hypothetical protein
LSVRSGKSQSEPTIAHVAAATAVAAMIHVVSGGRDRGDVSDATIPVAAEGAATGIDRSSVVVLVVSL